jgi:hypothetical protein
MLEGWRATIRSETWQKLSQDTEFLFDLVDDHPAIRLSQAASARLCARWVVLLIVEVKARGTVSRHLYASSYQE